MSKKLLVVFDIDETLIHYVDKKYTDLFFDLPNDVQEKFNYIREGKEEQPSSIVLLRPGIKELLDYYNNNPDISVALWTYSEEEYADNIGNLIVEYLGLPEDFFLFKYGVEQIQEISPDEDKPKNLEKVYEDFPDFNKFNTFLVDDAMSNIKHDVNKDNSLLIQPFAPFGVEKVRQEAGEDSIEEALNDNILDIVQEISDKALKDIKGCDIEDIEAGEESIFDERRIGENRMDIEDLVRKFAKPGTVTDLVTIGNPKASKNLDMICGGKKKMTKKKKGNKKKMTKKKKGGKKTKEKLKLKKNKCCCGATKQTPCVCMILGSQCSSTGKKCYCFKLLELQNKN